MAIVHDVGLPIPEYLKGGKKEKMISEFFSLNPCFILSRPYDIFVYNIAWKYKETPKNTVKIRIINIYYEYLPYFNIYYETYDITTFPMFVMRTDASSRPWNPYVLRRQVARVPHSRASRGFCVHFLKVEKFSDFVMLFKNIVVSLLFKRR